MRGTSMIPPMSGRSTHELLRPGYVDPSIPRTQGHDHSFPDEHDQNRMLVHETRRMEVMVQLHSAVTKLS